MDEVVNLSAFRRQHGTKMLGERIQAEDLNELLKVATDLRDKIQRFQKTLEVMDFEGLKKVFEARLAEVILETGQIDINTFLCSNYVAALLTEFGSSVPESWFAVDYFIKAEAENKPIALRQGANVCFIISSIFPPRGQIRCMKLEDYEAIGKAMYYNYYCRAKTAVAYLMSLQFDKMAEITKECVSRLH